MRYFGGRWYDPEIGRFITVDPAEDGENWYIYTNNNPINNVDPNGYFTTPWQTLQLFAGLAEESVIMAGFAIVIGALTPYIAPILPILVPFLIYQGITTVVNDVTYMIKNFNQVFIGRPTDEQCRQYGKAIARTFSTIVFGIASVKRVKGYNSSRQFQNQSGWGKSYEKESEWHHLVQQHEINVQQFGKPNIHNIFNMIKLPPDIHLRITKYTNSKIKLPDGTMEIARVWLSKKPYVEQYYYGVKILLKGLFNLLKKGEMP